jgi:DNA-binding NarL/FixJ family response regulator
VTSQEALRVVIAEDTVLLREGLRRVLTDAGLEVAGVAGDAAQLLQLVAAQPPARSGAGGRARR